MQRNISCFLSAIRYFSSESQIRRNIFVGKNNQKWSIFVAVAIIRPPIIAPQMSDSEKNYSFFTKNLEIETSLLCDFELKEIDDKKLYFFELLNF